MIEQQRDFVDAVLLLCEEAAYADLGTTIAGPVREPSNSRAIVRLAIISTRSVPVVTQDWSDWSWATAPPRRAA